MAAARPSTKPRARRPRTASLKVERSMLARGHEVVVGLDEVGRGAWAGPMFVGVVAVDATTRAVPAGTRDSKALAPTARRALRPLLVSWCAAWGIGRVSAHEIDEYGLTAALRLGAERALFAMPRPATSVIVDGPVDFVSEALERAGRWGVEVVPIVGADDRCASVAAASVLAKVARDDVMRRLGRQFPSYDFRANKGYGTSAHAEAVATHGLTSEHRRSWTFAERAPTDG
jgi:ribonuclease HII